MAFVSKSLKNLRERKNKNSTNRKWFHSSLRFVDIWSRKCSRFCNTLSFIQTFWLNACSCYYFAHVCRMKCLNMDLTFCPTSVISWIRLNCAWNERTLKQSKHGKNTLDKVQWHVSLSIFGTNVTGLFLVMVSKRPAVNYMIVFQKR